MLLVTDAAQARATRTFPFTPAPAAPRADRARTLAGSPGEGVRQALRQTAGPPAVAAGAGCHAVAAARRR